MKNAILGLQPFERQRLSAALRSGALTPLSALGLRSELGLDGHVDALLFDLRELESQGITGPGAAAWIDALDQAIGRQPRADLVWSGEEIDGLHARDTRAVFEELLGKASESLWISSYTYFDGPKAFKVLGAQMDRTPELETTLLLNIQRKAGDATASDDLVRRFADRFWSNDWPGERRPRVFYDPRALELDGPPAVLHAKAVVADMESVFVTSANLTESAFDRNIEMGLLVRDRALGLSVVRHFQALIERGLVRTLPG
ncbi:MAG: DISARM system phospholipase D-like protein DrmC [Longimicrobiales bacterium]